MSKRMIAAGKVKGTKGRPHYNSKGWILCKCKACGRANYVEPHGTTAPCVCSPLAWTEHEPIN